MTPKTNMIWSVAGASGKTGKSTVAANMAYAMAEMGLQVALFDAQDKGLGLYSYFGMERPPEALEEVHVPVSAGPRVLEAGGGGLTLVNGAPELLKDGRDGLIGAFAKGHFVVVDIGFPESPEALDFMAASDASVIVTTPSNEAVHSAYALLKAFVFRRITVLFSDNEFIMDLIKQDTDSRNFGNARRFSDMCSDIAVDFPDAAGRAFMEIESFRPRLIINMAETDEDVLAADAFKKAVGQFLGHNVDYVGMLRRAKEIEDAHIGKRPFLLGGAAPGAKKEFEEIISVLMSGHAEDGESMRGDAGETSMIGRGHPQTFERHIPVKGPFNPPLPLNEACPRVSEAGGETFGFNDNVAYKDTVFHVQTEVNGARNAPIIDTVVYHSGRIFFSKKTQWAQVVREGDMHVTIRDYAKKQHHTVIAAVKMNKISLNDGGK
ncbi:MAG: P-loop NTPase [Deltaproteobacteria bacterium]|nr:P-loop NTPase [Deltaproteobacteria bacterium]